jgi:hypothetical protein
MVMMAERVRPILPLHGHAVRSDGRNVADRQIGHLHVEMRCSTTAGHLMGIFRTMGGTISLTRTSIVPNHPSSLGARVVPGMYTVAEGYPGCAACGAPGYFQCSNCRTVSCWNGAPVSWCAACGARPAIDGSITAIAAADGG